jgi:hypothetical protein
MHSLVTGSREAGVFTPMMEELAAVSAEPETAMIAATYLKERRTASSLRTYHVASGRKGADMVSEIELRLARASGEAAGANPPPWVAGCPHGHSESLQRVAWQEGFQIGQARNEAMRAGGFLGSSVLGYN